jgi:glycosyltransferase involved in cell wall biosynthesis
MTTTTGVRTSVVIAAYDAWETLPQVLEALRPQVEARSDRELVLVESSQTHTAAELERRWPWLRAVVPSARMWPGEARNLGAEQVRGELVAFTDADAIPEPHWLDELERALQPGTDAVAGVVLNGTPKSVLGTSDYLLEFAAWIPGRSGAPLHGATCNLLVRRDVLFERGGFSTDIWPGEDTVFTFPLGEAGLLAFAPAARVRHLNRTRLREVVRHQYALGLAFRDVCHEVAFPHRTFMRLPLALVAGPLRIPVLWYRLVRWRRVPRASAVLVPVALTIGCAWSAGATVAGVRGALGRPRRKHDAAAS